MSKEKHTPATDLSLGLDEVSDVICLMKGDIDIAYMAFPGVQGRKDGERILKALNNHDRLVEALEDLIDAARAHTESHIHPLVIEQIEYCKQLLTELKA